MVLEQTVGFSRQRRLVWVAVWFEQVASIDSFRLVGSCAKPVQWTRDACVGQCFDHASSAQGEYRIPHPCSGKDASNGPKKQQKKYPLFHCGHTMMMMIATTT